MPALYMLALLVNALALGYVVYLRKTRYVFTVALRGDKKGS